MQMYETAEEVTELQALLDRSHGGSGDHMRSIVTDERRLTAEQVVKYMQGVKHVSLGTLTSKGEPFVAPLDGLFIHGHWFISTAGNSLRVKHLRRNRAASLCHMVGDDIGIWAHGTVELFDKGEGLAPEWERIATSVYGESPYN
jgi:general stress protein 26